MEWSREAINECILRVKKQAKPIKVRIIVDNDGIRLMDRETGDVIQNNAMSTVRTCASVTK